MIGSTMSPMLPGNVAFFSTTSIRSLDRTATLVAQSNVQRNAKVRHRIFDASEGGEIDGVAGDADDEQLA
jgi:hypothetical protein